MSPRSYSLFPSSLLTLAVVVALPAHAQSSDASRALDEIVVTGTRSEDGPPALAASTVIERAEIERLQPASLMELLRGQPGLAIYNQGGAGKVSGLFLRGTSPGQVLVLVDGVRIGAPANGMPALWDIPVAQVERIEIVRGPLSSLYGSDAVGGVIQVFTRRGRREGVHPVAGLAIGSERTLRADAGVDGRSGRGWFSAGVAHEQTRGFNACGGDPVTFAGCGTIEPDRDGYRNDSLRLGAGIDLNAEWQAEARVLRTEGRNEFDGGWANENRNVQQVVGGQLRFKPSDRLALVFRAGRNDDDTISRVAASGQEVDRVDSRRDSANLQADIGSQDRLLSVGIDWQRDRVDASTRFDRDHRLSRALYAQWRGDFGAHHLQLGARREDNSQFGGASTGNLAWGWDLREGLRLVASHGTGFRAPTFNDLYYPGFSNPDLRPERSRASELGLEAKAGWGSGSLRAYRTRLRDLIVYNPALTSPRSPYGMPDNVQLARIDGLEATLAMTLAGWDLNATASLLDPRNETPGPLDGKRLNRRAQRIARIDADRRFGDWRIGASVNASGDRYDDPANQVRLGGYATTDLRVGYAPSADWSLQLSAHNVFDRAYETARWYHQAGRTWVMSLRWHPAD